MNVKHGWLNSKYFMTHGEGLSCHAMPIFIMDAPHDPFFGECHALTQSIPTRGHGDPCALDKVFVFALQETNGQFERIVVVMGKASWI